MISALYAAAARRRRERYARRPDLRRRLRHPVISIGNIAVGGRGKTPTVALLARMMLDMGERPAVLSRGYARHEVTDGVVVVRDPDGIRADLRRSGDEPLMLAKQLPGVSVLVSSDRYAAGRLAEHHLAATVHLLDDGFQHLQLDRDIDLVIVSEEDLDPGAGTLPGGWLREPVDTLLVADVVLASEGALSRLPQPKQNPFEVFRLRRHIGRAQFPDGAPDHPRAIAVAGIARPEVFFEDARAAGWDIVRARIYDDHHPYTRSDVDRLCGDARAAGTSVITTEKDYVRLLPFRPFPVPVGWLPLTMEVEPLTEFRHWLADALRSARDIPLD